jgi:hypothetical protein
MQIYLVKHTVSVHKYLEHGICPAYLFARERKYCVPNTYERPL